MFITNQINPSIELKHLIVKRAFIQNKCVYWITKDMSQPAAMFDA